MKALLVLSPLAGLTDAPFRELAVQYGADYGVTEMLTSQLQLWQTAKSQQRLQGLEQMGSKRILQIAGGSAELIAQAVNACAMFTLDAIEINMGCPAKKVCKVLAGSALLRDEKLVADILQAAVKASKVPIYLKTRLGWDHASKNILTIAKLAEDCGVQSLAIHGRTRSDMYNGCADYDLIAQVKQALSIPVFANGDITTPQQAKQVLEYTAADGLYIGRGVLGKPWLFDQIKSFLATGTYPQMAQTQIKDIILKHVQSIHRHYGISGVVITRKHIKYYMAQNTQLLTEHDFVASEFMSINSLAEQLAYLQFKL